MRIQAGRNVRDCGVRQCRDAEQGVLERTVPEDTPPPHRSHLTTAPVFSFGGALRVLSLCALPLHPPTYMALSVVSWLVPGCVLGDLTRSEYAE